MPITRQVTWLIECDRCHSTWTELPPKAEAINSAMWKGGYHVFANRKLILCDTCYHNHLHQAITAFGED